MASQIQKKAIQAFENIWKRVLCPLEMQWDHDIETVCVKKSFTRRFCFCVTFSLNVILMLACVYDVLGFIVFKRNWPGMDPSIACLLTIAGFGLLISTVFVRIAFRNRDALLGLNSLLKLKNQIFADFNQHDHLDLIDAILCAGAPLSLLVPLGIYFSSLAFNFDPLYFLLEDISSSPDYRSTSEIIRNFVIRGVTLIGGFETGRICGHGGVFGLLGMEVFKKSMNVLQRSDDIPVATVLRYYNMLLISYFPCKMAFLEAISFFISLSFWIVVFSAVVMIKCYDLVNLYIYCVIVGISTFACVLLYAALVTVSKLNEVCNAVLNRCSRKTKENWKNKGANGFEAKCLHKAVKATKVVNIVYHPFFQINRRFMFDVLNNAVDRLVDFLILFGSWN